MCVIGDDTVTLQELWGCFAALLQLNVDTGSSPNFFTMIHCSMSRDFESHVCD